jgi:molybdate/tungstate transport system ATP-binding protein
LLVIEELKKALAPFVLEIPRLEVPKGETCVLLGPTGAGKSSFLELLAGFSQPDAGRISVDGSDVTELPADQRRISILFQEAHLFPHLNVRDNIGYGANDTALFHQVIELLGLENLLTHGVSVLSGGERQLVALGRALMVRPHVLLLDEPFSSIDPQSRKSVIEAFRRVHREVQITSLMVTHNFEEGLHLADRLGVLMGGKLVQTGAPQEVFSTPASEQIARFLGAENLFAGHFESVDDSQSSTLFKTDSATLHVLADHEGPGYALIQPEEITLSLEPLQSSALNQFRGKVEDIIHKGSLIQLEIDAGLAFKVFITSQSLQEMQLAKGSEIHLTFKASSVKTY